MKKILLSAVTFCLLSGLFAQDESNNKGVYVSFKTGYSIPVAKSTVGSPRAEVGNRLLVSSEEGTYTSSLKNPFGSRGAGFTASGSVGYMFGDNFGIEMEFSFLRSTKILDARRDQTILDGSTAKTYFAEQYSYTNMFRAAPMLVVSGNPNKKFTPYAKFGVLLPLAGKTIVEVNINDETGELSNQLLPVLNTELADSIASRGLSIPIPTQSKIKAKTSGSFSLGFAARIGGAYNINDKWAIFGELEMNMLTIKAKETEFVEFSAQVPEALAILAESLLDIEEVQFEYGYYDIPEILRLTKYVDEVTENSNSAYVAERKNEPYEQLTFRDSYNSFGLMVGVKYRFR